MPKAMIITVGGTPVPLITSIEEQHPSFICYLASQNTIDMVSEIKKSLSSNIESQVVVLDNVNDLLHCYQKSVEASDRVLKKGFLHNEVVVDYTGGTKNMSAAIVLATITHSFLFSYVGGTERDKKGVGVVKDGKEKVYTGVNPWDFLAVEEKRKIGILFNSFQYQGAKNLIEEVKDKVSPSYQPIFEILAVIVEGFYMWDMFQHKLAMMCFERARLDSLIDIAKTKEDINLLKFAEKVKQANGQLKKIVSISENGKKFCRPLMEDLFSNAERRYKEGKIDDAILRLYRIVEMAAQERLLTKYQIDTSNVDLKKVPNELRIKLEKEHKDKKDGKVKIPQSVSYQLLESLGDDLGYAFFSNRRQFLKIQSARNYSYLAHGIESSKDETYIHLRDFIKKLIKGIKGPIFPEMNL